MRTEPPLASRGDKNVSGSSQEGKVSQAVKVAHISLPIPTTLESLPISPPSPPEEPPGVRRGSYGLFDTPKRAVLHSNESIV